MFYLFKDRQFEIKKKKSQSLLDTDGLKNENIQDWQLEIRKSSSLLDKENLKLRNFVPCWTKHILN